MKKIYLLFFLTSVVSIARSQNLIVSDNTTVKRCATVEALAEARRLNPNAETDAHFESWISNMIQQRRNMQPNSLARLAVVNFNLPVIFHVISAGETVGSGNNVSQAIITQQLLQINKDFANQSNSPYAVALNSGLQFSFAQKDPSGAPLSEPGIDRITATAFPYNFTSPASNYSISYIDATVKPSTYWDPTKYINVWVVPNPVSGSVALYGYATLPASSGLSDISSGETVATAGVVIRTSSIGSVFQPFACADPVSKGRTLTHELGHFFGLKHINGDAICGNDYCGDTPVHEVLNRGVPTHPKPNNCSTPDEMFENYMDYSDDVVTNTFTVNQVDRMQMVMLNSPRRVTLATSTVGLVAATATNRIAFNDCTGVISVNESGTTGTYPRYRDINLYLNVEDKATGAATVTLTGGGTAVAGRDYTFPIPAVTFAAGDNFKPVIIRIIDDAAVDGNKTLTVGFTISGTGVTAGTASQNYTVNITDDDNYVTTEKQITLINEGFEGALPGWGSFISTGSPNSFVSSLNGRAGGTGAAIHITNNTTTRPNTYTKTTAASAALRTPILNVSGLQNINVTFNYRVWGEASASTAYDFGQLRYATIAAPTSFAAFANTPAAGPYAGITDSVTGVANITLPAAFNFSQFYLAFYWSNDAADGNNPPFNFDNVVVKADGIKVETTVSSSYGYDVPVSTTNNFRSTNNKSIIALSAVNTNLTNVAVAVTEAGSDRPSFTANGTTYLRTRKVIAVNPSPANATAQYTLKLYYTSDELAAWGGNTANLKIMKVNSGVSLSSPLNNSNAVIVTPSLVEDNIASGGYAAFTATFTGFSQFVLVEANAVLPVKWLLFTGIFDKNRIKLNWKTADEINNKGFEVERSTNAVSFEKIGWVDASATNSYELFDASIAIGNTYYYRLKQVDKDGNYAYSPVVKVMYRGNNAITIFPNPVKDKLVIQQTGTGRTSIVVTDLTGKKVYSTTFAAGSLAINAQSWSKGLYLVSVFKDEEVSTFKIIKQ